MTRWFLRVIRLRRARHRAPKYEDLHDDAALDIIEQLDRELHS